MADLIKIPPIFPLSMKKLLGHFTKTLLAASDAPQGKNNSLTCIDITIFALSGKRVRGTGTEPIEISMVGNDFPFKLIHTLPDGLVQP